MALVRVVMRGLVVDWGVIVLLAVVELLGNLVARSLMMVVKLVVLVHLMNIMLDGVGVNMVISSSVRMGILITLVLSLGVDVVMLNTELSTTLKFVVELVILVLDIALKDSSAMELNVVTVVVSLINIVVVLGLVKMSLVFVTDLVADV